MFRTLTNVRFSRRVHAALASAVVLLIFGFTATAAFEFFLRHPFTDSWNFVPFLRAWHSGEVTWTDLWEPYQSHRIPLARICLVLLAETTAWNHGVEVGLSLFCLAAAFGVAVALFAHSARVAGRRFPWLLLPAIAILVFNLAQSVNLVWGWQCALVFSVAANVAALALFRSPAPAWTAVAAAIVLNICATFVHGAGLLGWPAGVVALLSPRLWRGTVPWAGLCAWCAAMMACTALYLWGLGEPFRTGEAAGLLERISITLRYVPVFIGGPVASVRPWLPAYAGILGLGAAATVLARLFLVRGPALRATGPWLGMLTYPVFAAVLVAWGRARAGEDLTVVGHGSLLEGAVSRYPTVALWFWVALIALGWLALGSPREQNTAETEMARARLRPAPWSRPIALAGLALILLSTLLSTRQGYYDAQAFQRFLYPYARSVVLGERNVLPDRLQYYYGDEHTEDVRWLRERGWSLFRPGWSDYWRRNAPPFPDRAQ